MTFLIDFLPTRRHQATGDVDRRLVAKAPYRRSARTCLVRLGPEKSDEALLLAFGYLRHKWRWRAAVNRTRPLAHWWPLSGTSMSVLFHSWAADVQTAGRNLSSTVIATGPSRIGFWEGGRLAILAFHDGGPGLAGRYRNSLGPDRRHRLEKMIGRRRVGTRPEV